MSKWFPSDAAKAQGVCHTSEEGNLLYLNLPERQRVKARHFIHTHFTDALPGLSKSMKKDPENWMGPFHFTWGMAFRNELRRNGLGEQFFDVHNLDCIQQPLLEDAVKAGGF